MMLAVSATVWETIERHTALLAERGVESPRLQSELLLAAALRVPRLNLYLDTNKPILHDVLVEMEESTRRRSNREPFQQIVGSTSFCGIEIAVRRGVFIPRPETELLAERALEVLAQPNRFEVKPSRVLDFGTGTGCIAVALAAKNAEIELVALDKSPAALDLARENAAQYRLAHRIQFLLADRLAVVPAGLPFDLVVSNPPYIPTAEIQTLSPEVRDFDPFDALNGGADGLDTYRMLADSLPAHLAPNGCWLAEFGDGQSDSLQDLLRSRGWRVECIWPDYSGRLRIFKARLATAAQTHG